MDTNEYLSYVTNSVIALESRIKAIEDTTIRVFTYTVNNLTYLRDEFNEFKSSYNTTYDYNILFDKKLEDTQTYIIANVNNKLQSEIENIQKTISEISEEKELIKSEISNKFDIIDNKISQVCKDCNIKIQKTTKSSAVSKWFRQVKEHIYNFVFYFKIQQERKSELIAEQKRKEEEIKRQKAEEEALRLEQERLEKIKKEQEERLKEEEKQRVAAEQRRQQEIAALNRIKQQKENNIINNILGNIHKNKG